MKKPNKLAVKIVAGIAATGIGLYACSDDDLIYDKNENEEAGKMPDNGQVAIKTVFSEEDVNYLLFLDKLGKDIITTPSIARDFAKDPETYTKKYGYNEKVYLEENMLKLILAFGDDDINAAISVGDTKTALLLMKDKELLDQGDFTKVSIDDEQRKQLLAAMGVDEVNFDQYGVCTLATVCNIAGVVNVAAAVTAVGAVAAYAMLWTKTMFWGYGVDSQNISNFTKNNAPLQMWSLRGQSENTYIAADMYLEQEINNLVDAIEAVDNTAFEKGLTKENFKNFMKLNILNQQ